MDGVRGGWLHLTVATMYFTLMLYNKTEAKVLAKPWIYTAALGTLSNRTSL
jgi:hypothetical protein